MLLGLEAEEKGTRAGKSRADPTPEKLLYLASLLLQKWSHLGKLEVYRTKNALIYSPHPDSTIVNILLYLLSSLSRVCVCVCVYTHYGRV